VERERERQRERETERERDRESERERGKRVIEGDRGKIENRRVNKNLTSPLFATTQKNNCATEKYLVAWWSMTV
jgi:hypothetical protein